MCLRKCPSIRCQTRYVGCGMEVQYVARANSSRVFQVNPEGSDPEETDSDRESGEDETSGTKDSPEEEEEDEENDHDESDTDFSPRKRKPKSRMRGGSTRGSLTKRVGQITHNVDLASAIGVGARLPPCQIGAVELLTFFPNHTQWPEAGLRLYRNGWAGLEIAKVQLHARGRLNKKSCDKRDSALKHQVLTNGAAFFNADKFQRASHAHLMTAVTTYDASAYAPRASVAWKLTTTTLVDIARGVAIWPTGQDRGIVTQAIEYARQNGLNQLTTADIPGLAQQLGFAAPSEASGAQWDQRARERAVPATPAL